jgi:hypothetical protein
VFESGVKQQCINFEEMEILQAENASLKKDLQNSKHANNAQNDNENQTILALEKENKELKKQVKRNECAQDVEAALFELKIEQKTKIEQENKLLKQELLALQENAVRGGKSTNEDIQKMKQSYEDKLWELDNLFRRDYSRLEATCKNLSEQLKNTKPLEFRERENLVAKIRVLKQQDDLCKAELSQSLSDRRAIGVKLQRSKQTLDKYVRRMNQYGQKVKKEFLKREQQIAELQEQTKDLMQQRSLVQEKTNLFASSSLSDAQETLIKNLEQENVKILGENQVL